MSRQNPQGGESPERSGRSSGGQNPERTGRSGTGETPERYGASGGESSSRTGQSTGAREGRMGGESSQTSRGAGSQGESGTSLMGHDIIGRHVRLQSGEDIGEIEDLVVEPRGRVIFAVVTSNADGAPGGAGGTRGMGSPEERTGGREGGKAGNGGACHLVPWSALQAGTGGGGGAYTAKFGRDKLTSAPKFDRSRPGDMGTQSQSRIYQHYGVTPEREGSSGRQETGGRSGQGMESGGSGAGRTGASGMEAGGRPGQGTEAERGRASKGQQRPGQERSTGTPPPGSEEDDM
jgi:hypothetical protein